MIDHKCADFGRQLGLRLDNELEAPDMRALDAHLATCTRCQREMENMAVLERAYPSLHEPEIPSAQWDAAWDVIRKEIPSPAPVFVPPLQGTWQRAALAAAAIFVFAVLGFYAANEARHSVVSPKIAAPSGTSEDAALSCEILSLDADVDGYTTIVYTSTEQDITILWMIPDEVDPIEGNA